MILNERIKQRAAMEKKEKISSLTYFYSKNKRNNCGVILKENNTKSNNLKNLILKAVYFFLLFLFLI